MQVEPPRGIGNPLAYAEAEGPWRPRRCRIIGAASVVTGSLGLVLNGAAAAVMFKQLLKQVSGRGAAPRPVEPWLTTVAVELTLSATLAAVVAVAGLITICNPGLGPRLHRWCAWAKLPLACVFAVWAGWYITLFVSSEWTVVGAAAVLALIVSTAYPLFCLRMFSRPAARDRKEMRR